MNDAPDADRGGLSILTLEFEVLDDRPDWPVVTIRVDGQDPFAKVARNWRGFDPSKILGPNSPLVPDDNGCRVAVYRCSCGEAGCGVIAPYVVASPDRKRISWVDFRDYVGVFGDPVAPSIDEYEGSSWNLPDIHFDRGQYRAEVERASSDRSWETPRRQIARHLHDQLTPMELILPPDLTLAWVTPARSADGAVVNFQHITREPEYRIQQQMLYLASSNSDPVKAAEDMADQLLSVSPNEWASTFGHRIS